MSAELIAATCALAATAGAIYAGVWRAAQITAHVDQMSGEIRELKKVVAALTDKLQAQEVWMAGLGFRRDEVTNPGVRR